MDSATTANTQPRDDSTTQPDYDNNDAAPDLRTPPQQPAPAPGPRATRLQELYAVSLKRTLNKLGWDNFAGCYPTVAKRAEGVLRQVQGQMVAKLGEKCEKEFESIIISRQVVSKLNELEGLVSDASRRQKEANSAKTQQVPTPPHTLSASSILAAHLHPTLTQRQSQLNARLQTTQAQNLLLADQVRHQRAEIAALLDALDAKVDDVRSANAALAPLADELAAEARDSVVAADA